MMVNVWVIDDGNQERRWQRFEEEEGEGETTGQLPDPSSNYLVYYNQAGR